MEHKQTKSIRVGSVTVGGGAPIRESNRDYLRRNGRIYLLERSLAQLDRAGRPLSSSAKANI